MSGQSLPPSGSKLQIEHDGQELHVTFIKEDSGYGVFKLASGYNVRFPLADVKIIKIYDISQDHRKTMKEETNIGRGAHRISLLSTGGTISSRVDYTTGAVRPTKDLSFIREAISDLEDRINLRTEIIDSILSENMTPSHWIKISHDIKKAMESSEAVVLLHGTDTMSYTASALSFMFEKQTAPVIMTGSQRSSDRPSSDAFENIESSIRFSLENIGEVGICMHANSSDGSAILIRGVRARKMHTSRRDAFKPMGDGEMGRINDRRTYIKNIRKKTDSSIELFDQLDSRCGIFYFTPASSEEELENFSRGKKAVVIMATGLGHVAEALLKKIRDLSDSGVHIVITSQCLNGRVDLDVYASGRNLSASGAIPVEDMLPETAMVKSMYALKKDPDNFAKLMQSDLRGEITLRSETVEIR